MASESPRGRYTDHVAGASGSDLRDAVDDFVAATGSFPRIALAGVDGAGKSTQVRSLCQWLVDRSLPAVPLKTKLHHHEILFRLSAATFGDPYDYHPHIPVDLREFTLACDVAQHYFKNVGPVEADGHLAILDRGVLCYRAYARAYGAESEWIWKTYDLIGTSEVTVLIDVDPLRAIDRLGQRTEKLQRADENLELLQLVRSSYLELVEGRPDVAVIDGSGTPEEVGGLVRHALRTLITRRVRAQLSKS